MNHNLHRFIQGIRQDNPAFTWQPAYWHSVLAEHIPAPAVYGLFGEATYDGEVLQVRDDWGRVERFKPELVKALGSVKVEYIR